MNLSNNTIWLLYKLPISALFLVSGLTFTLRAMESENTNHQKKSYTLVCANNVTFQVNSEVLSQSATITQMITDYMDISDSLKEESLKIFMPKTIHSTIMKSMIQYMQLATNLKEQGQTKLETILELGGEINDKIPNQSERSEYLKAAQYLDFKLFLHAHNMIVTLAIYNNNSECLNLGINHSWPRYLSQYPNYLWNLLLTNPDQEPIIDGALDIQKTYYLISGHQLDTSKPVSILLDDLASLGFIDDKLQTLDRNTIEYLCTFKSSAILQSILNSLIKLDIHSAIKAHEALIDYIKTLTPQQIEMLFNKEKNNSTLKTALNLIYQEKAKKYLDASPFDLQYLIPLRQAINGKPTLTLKLINQKLHSIPDTIAMLTNLKQLDLSDNNITSLPDAIGTLVNLEMLSVKGNQLTAIPNSICNLSNLKLLDLSGNKITILPDDIGNLVNLAGLNFANNLLSHIPNTIGNITALGILGASENQLTDIPATISKCMNLQNFYLYNNKIPEQRKKQLVQLFGEKVIL